MRTVYRALAFIVAAEVVIQAMAMVYAVAGLSRWLTEGGVLDKAVTENDEFAFPEIVGLVIHGVNGMLIIPLAALLLLITSFFAKVPGGAKWAGIVLLLVVLQATLGLAGHSIPVLGALHGFNALLLFSAAVITGRRARRTQETAVESSERVATPV
jgi:hypothetical protein